VPKWRGLPRRWPWSSGNLVKPAFQKSPPPWLSYSGTLRPIFPPSLRRTSSLEIWGKGSMPTAADRQAT
jgi:hypothetical protein